MRVGTAGGNEVHDGSALWWCGGGAVSPRPCEPAINAPEPTGPIKDRVAETVSEIRLSNARVILADEVVQGSVTMADGLIKDISTGPDTCAGAVDCDGDYLAPGLVELHTDNLERHITPRPRVRQHIFDALLAHDGELASTGITTVFDALRIGSVLGEETSSDESQSYAFEAAQCVADERARSRFRIDHKIHIRAELCSHTLCDELEQFESGLEDRIGIVSIMDHTPGQRQFRNHAQHVTYLKGKHGMTDSQVDKCLALRREIHSTLGETHKRRAIAFAGSAGAIIASHDDTTIEDVAQSHEMGCSIAEFPTTLEAAGECARLGLEVIMGAPNLLRGGSHSDNVAASELIEPGHLAILSSDYIPSALLRAAIRLAEITGDMPRAMARVTSAPARAARLDDRGSIAVGKRADLLRFATERNHAVVRGVWSAGRQVA